MNALKSNTGVLKPRGVRAVRGWGRKVSDADSRAQWG